MKKLTILAAALTGLSVVVSAQQNDFFDVQKYLQKMHKENKKPQKLTLIKPSFENLFINPELPQPNIRKFSFTLPNGDKVYTLGQDNMPCIVPDIKQFYCMPNLFNYDQYSQTIPFPKNAPGSIPNAALPPHKKIFISK